MQVSSSAIGTAKAQVRSDIQQTNLNYFPNHSTQFAASDFAQAKATTQDFITCGEKKEQ
jgi:hypothetical protein